MCTGMWGWQPARPSRVIREPAARSERGGREGGDQLSHPGPGRRGQRYGPIQITSPWALCAGSLHSRGGEAAAQ